MRSGHAATQIRAMDRFIANADGRLVGLLDRAGRRDIYWREDVELQIGTQRYVDTRTAAQGGKGSAGHDGRSWETPLLTMAAALNVAQDFDTINFVGRISEQGLVSAKSYITIRGGGPQPKVNACWKPSGWGLTVNHKGWVFENFKIEPATDMAFVRAVQSAGVNGSDGVFANVEVNGGFALLQGVSVDNWSIVDVLAHDMQTVITVTDVLHSAALRWLIAGCRFMNNDNHVVAALGDSVIMGNLFQAIGNSKTTTTKLNTFGGAGRNIVTQNVMTGTYDIANGYRAHANDSWYDNNISSGKTSSLPV